MKSHLENALVIFKNALWKKAFLKYLQRQFGYCKLYRGVSIIFSYFLGHDLKYIYTVNIWRPISLRNFIKQLLSKKFQEFKSSFRLLLQLIIKAQQEISLSNFLQTLKTRIRQINRTSFRIESNGKQKKKNYLLGFWCVDSSIRDLRKSTKMANQRNNEGFRWYLYQNYEFDRTLATGKNKRKKKDSR